MVNATELPVEIISAIFYFVEAPRLPGTSAASSRTRLGQYVGICKAWQPVIEERVFEFIRLNSARVKEASTILCRRCRFIRQIQLTVQLHGSRAEDVFVQYNNAVVHLFAIFADNATTRHKIPLPPLKFRISCSELSIGEQQIYLGDIGHGHPPMRIMPSSFEDIPTIQQLDELHIESTSMLAYTVLAAMCRISSRLPNLRVWSFVVPDGATPPLSHLKIRLELGLDQLPTSLESFQFCYRIPPDQLDTEQHQSLSKSLYQLAMRPAMRLFHINGPFETSLIGDWPGLPGAFSEMTEFVVSMNAETPSGVQLLLPETHDFVPQGRDTRTIQYNQRTETLYTGSDFSIVNEAVMNPILVRAAAMASKMPRLQRFSIQLLSRYTFKVAYKHGHLAVHNHHLYIPPPDVLRAWHSATTANLGQHEALSVMITSSGHRLPDFKIGET
ncbi:hypothetical protein VHEMI06318 [[Torrubiella] hemipterigena]|uniref:Uncharacterized protein n=1 Tax=[Torrubiella] hemipterigena TaxID=1531966 RepID=A0A0A1T092_9HYPO|nr:hypothetical protein VHEMI06318 [[Torrubiella] hemipterigena]